MWKWVAGIFFTTIVGVSVLFAPRGAAQQPYPLEPFQCPAGQFTYAFNPVTGGLPGWFCATPGVVKQIITPPATTVGDLAVWGNTNGTSLIDNGTAFPSITVANNNALKALPVPTAGTVAYRAGFATAGDGGGATYTFSASNCPISGGDNGSEVQPTTGTGCWVLSPPASGVSVMVWGAVPETSAAGCINDNSAAFTAAAAAVSNVYVPPGFWHFKNSFTVPSAHAMRGAGHNYVTVFTIGCAAGNDYNMAAPAAPVVLGNTGVEPGTTFDGIEILGYQPDTSVRANLIEYPVAVLANNTPGIALGIGDGLRMQNVWSCLNLENNSTLGKIGLIECGAYSGTGDSVSGGITESNGRGSIDFTTVLGSPNFFPNMTTNQQVVYTDGTTILMNVGRCDACHFGVISSYGTGQIWNNITPSQISIDFDGMDNAFAPFSYTGGVNGIMQIGSFYFDGTHNNTQSGITCNSGSIRVGQTLWLFSSAAPSDISLTNACKMNLGLGSIVEGVNSSNPTILVASSSVLTMTSEQVITTTNAARTAPIIHGTDGFVNAQGNSIGTIGTGSGNWLQLDTDNIQNVISNNDTGGWGYSLGFSTFVGYYDINTPITITATPEFQVNNAFAPTGVTAQGTYFLHGTYADFTLYETWSNNNYSSSPPTGAFFLATNLPVALGPGSSKGDPVVVNEIDNVTFGANTFPCNGQINGLSQVAPTICNSGTTAGNWSPSNIPSGTANIGMVVSGRYRVR